MRSIGDHWPPWGGPSSGAVATGCSLGLVLVAIAFVLGPGVAGATLPNGFAQASDDTQAPSVGDLTRVDTTTVELTIGDDTDVNESSITASDFELSTGQIASVSASDDGSDAIVTISLAKPIDSDELTVGFANRAVVTDTAGNELDTTVQRTVSGMDGVRPTVETFSVAPRNNTTVAVTVTATEALNVTTIGFDGPTNATLQAANLTASDDGRTLTGTTTLPMAGNYTATLERVTDAAGNPGAAGQTARIATAARPPDAVAAIDVSASTGTTITLDGSQSTAEDPIASMTWDLGDGTEATGDTVTHWYRPGNYTATLRVTDADGDVGTDRVVIDLRGGEAEAPIDLDGTVEFGRSVANRSAVGESAIVNVGAPAAEPVWIARGDDPEASPPIAATSAFALDALTVEVGQETRYALAMQLDGAATVADVGNATSGRAIGGLTIVHDVPETTVGNVSVSFSVDRAHLEEYGDDPEDVRLLRYRNGSWHGLVTEQRGETNSTIRYRAKSPGLSRFAVATDPEGTAAPANATTPTPTPTPTATPTSTPATNETQSDPSVAVTNATLNRTSVDPGGMVGVSATVTNSGDGVAGFTAGLTVNGTVVDTQTLTIPPGANRSVSLVYQPNQTGSHDLVVNGTSAGTVQVGGGGGIVGSILGVFGFLPLGLIRTILTYLGGVLAAAFLALKAVALLLGY